MLIQGVKTDNNIYLKLIQIKLANLNDNDYYSSAFQGLTLQAKVNTSSLF